MLGKGPLLKATAVIFLSVVGKVFEKLVNRIVDHLEKCGLFISSMVLGLLDQLQIF